MTDKITLSAEVYPPKTAVVVMHNNRITKGTIVSISLHKGSSGLKYITYSVRISEGMSTTNYDFKEIRVFLTKDELIGSLK